MAAMSADLGARGPTLLREETFALSDGRDLAYAEWGDASGEPVVLLHGTPDSHIFSPDNYPVDETSAALGVRLITVSRSGYSRSTPHPGRTLLGWVDDLMQLADDLGLDRFALIGVSGGGPYAMACAVAGPDRLTALSLVSTGGPLDEVPGDWDVLPAEMRALVQLARQDPDRAAEQLAEESRWLVESPEAVLDPAGWPESDRWIVEGPEMRALVLDETREAGRLGSLGYVWDHMGRHQEWGFSPAQIRVPTLVWHGELDGIVGPRHFVYLALTIPGSHARMWPGEGHTAMLRGPHWGEVLRATTTGS